MFVLSLRVQSPIPIDLTGVLPGLTLDEAIRFPVLFGNRRVPIGELFTVAAAASMTIDGDGTSLHNVGLGMTGGHIEVRGSIGRHAGARMTGGTLTIRDDAGDWLGAEMRGGSIHLLGDAGSQVGAAYRGGRRGMSGGTIHIEGNAGDEVGLRMRRGIITVNGDCGEFAGAAMIAGTLIINGKIGARVGAGMTRGTIVTMRPPPLSPGFRFACEYEPQFLQLLKPGCGPRVKCFRGDLMTGGRGEIWHCHG